MKMRRAKKIAFCSDWFWNGTTHCRLLYSLLCIPSSFFPSLLRVYFKIYGEKCMPHKSSEERTYGHMIWMEIALNSQLISRSNFESKVIIANFNGSATPTHRQRRHHLDIPISVVKCHLYLTTVSAIRSHAAINRNKRAKSADLLYENVHMSLSSEKHMFISLIHLKPKPVIIWCWKIVPLNSFFGRNSVSFFCSQERKKHRRTDEW